MPISESEEIERALVSIEFLTTGEFNDTPSRDEARTLLIKLVLDARSNEVKRSTVGRVTDYRNKKSATYLGGFGYAANNLQRHKSKRLAELDGLKDEK